MRRAALLFLLGVAASAWAQDEIYRCGNEYVNNAALARAHSCVRVSERAEDYLNEQNGYREIGQSTRLRVFLNTKTVTSAGKYVKAWSNWSYKSEQKLRSGGEYQSSQNLSYYDCGNRTSAMRQTSYHRGVTTRGEVVSTLSTPEKEMEYEDAVPNSIGEELLTVVCRTARR